jgi:hypothetical protein
MFAAMAKGVPSEHLGLCAVFRVRLPLRRKDFTVRADFAPEATGRK